jgi:hypothetical protein
VLFVAIEPPKVPDVSGQTVSEATDTLEAEGFVVEETPLLDDTRQDGLVDSQSPTPGTSNASKVTLTVVRSPQIDYLADMDPVDSDYYSLETGSAQANGKSIPRSVTIDASEGFIDYQIGRKYRTFKMELGVEDDSSSSAAYEIQVLGDGRSLGRFSVAYGQTTPVAVDVTDVLRLKISIQASEEGLESSRVVLGDAQVQGVRSELDVAEPEDATAPSELDSGN